VRTVSKTWESRQEQQNLRVRTLAILLEDELSLLVVVLILSSAPILASLL
jgi:hypothetical protein